jgi:hypothetical protein
MNAIPRESAPVPAVTEILTDRAASAWLKESLERALERDPVDALNDALLLAAVLDAQLRAIFGLEEG